MPKQKEQPSLFIGRWQPFHAGHKALIETALKDEKKVIIAIRDTEVNVENPVSAYGRVADIQNKMKAWGSQVKVIIIPDFSEICYGRGVGYGIREIEMPEEVEAISGTKIREGGEDGKL